VQVYPQSWRYTSLTFNCILIAASVFFLACTSSARAATPRAGSDSHDGRTPSPLRPSQQGSGAVHIAAPWRGQQQQQRRPRLASALPRSGQGGRRGLETVEEVASSAERLSSMENSVSSLSVRDDRQLQ
jgi:hypothetical protein